MAKIPKLNTNFDAEDENDFFKIVTLIFNMLTKYVGDFPGLPVAMPAYNLLIGTWNTARTAIDYAGKVAATNAARTAIQTASTTNGTWLNSFCKGNLVLLKETGYPFAKEDSAQGVLDLTTLTLTNLVGTGFVEFLISFVPGAGVHYGILYTTADDTSDYTQWKFYYASQRDGVMKMLVKGEKYQMVSFGMGTSNELVYSPIVFVTSL